VTDRPIKPIAEYGSRAYVKNLERYLRKKTALIAALVAELERAHPPGVHVGFGIVGHATYGANVWGPIDYNADRSCTTCALIAKAKGEA
jgi:hypothetical protein